MNTTALKNFAPWARRELISRVSQKALQYGITENESVSASADSVNGYLLSTVEKSQRGALIRRIVANGYRQVMEEIAYTWFNRFIALRFMEVNDYLPSHIRIFSDEKGEFHPQILSEAIHLDMEGLNQQKVFAFKEASQTEALFKYLIITQCNALSACLPRMFQRIANDTELLFPDNLLREESVLAHLINDIPEDDWKDQVQIIGWLYQYYNTDLNNLVYDGTLSKAPIPKELLPAATTIYTPDWPVQYMVENSLGRLWQEGHPNDELKANWKYYLDEAEQEEAVQQRLNVLHEKYAQMTPEDIKVADICSGSGHILVRMFEVLMQIYLSAGYSERDAVSNIVQKNMYALDIDNRASQIAYFAVMMKARQYDRRFLTRGIQPLVFAIQESNGITQDMLDRIANGNATLAWQLREMVHELHDAKEYGSILKLPPVDLTALYTRLSAMKEDASLENYGIAEQLMPIVSAFEVLSQKYDVVVTNPPYLGSNRFSVKLSDYVKKEYPDEKSDLSMVMFKKTMADLVKPNGFISFITTSSWFFLSSFEKLRNYTRSNTTFTSIVDFGTELFEGKVGHNPIVSWVSRNTYIPGYKLTAVRLVDFCFSRRDEKEPEFFNQQNRYIAQQDNFTKIPGAPVAYWASETLIHNYQNNDTMERIAPPKQGTTIGDNERFLRLWFEVARIPNRWFPCAKGGTYRKWYGNHEYLINWENNGQAIKANGRATIRNQDYFFVDGIVWSRITSGKSSFRKLDNTFFFESAAGACFPNNDNLLYILGLLNSVVIEQYSAILNQTISLQSGDVARIPVLVNGNKKRLIDHSVTQNILISRTDWDSFETSWDFVRHPLIQGTSRISDAYNQWQTECEERFNQLKANEEELNRIFIDIYGLQDELTPEVEDKDVTVRKAELGRDIRSFISYAVGCMFGRYSLDVDGLAYAGGDWDANKYTSFPADADNIIPICDDEYFEDDIVGRFVNFVKTVYGEETLEENLQFIASALGGRGTARDIIRSYFRKDFYADHLKIYQKRPIYWQFESGKAGGFQALIYMHRYKPDTLARMRTDYVHEQQARYRTAIDDVQTRLNGATGSARKALSDRLAILNTQSEEIRLFEENLHHLADQMISIDLDDGVKVNYAKFQDILAKIK